MYSCLFVCLFTWCHYNFDPWFYPSGLPEPRIIWLKDYVPLDVYNNQRLRLIEKGKAKGKPISPEPPQLPGSTATSQYVKKKTELGLFRLDNWGFFYYNGKVAYSPICPSIDRLVTVRPCSGPSAPTFVPRWLGLSVRPSIRWNLQIESWFSQFGCFWRWLSLLLKRVVKHQTFVHLYYIILRDSIKKQHFCFILF